jgi:arsenate reductase
MSADVTAARVFNVLFLCTGNSARSILAESILARDGAGRFRAFSAGSTPKGEVNPFALRMLESVGYPTAGLRSKSWTEFAGADAPAMDFIFTVCDNAAGEACPVWPGHPTSAHWGIADPAAVEGTDMAKHAAFLEAFRYLKNRIDAFCSLPLAGIDAMALGARLREIGRGPGSTASQSDVA